MHGQHLPFASWRGALRHYVEKRGLSERIEIDSAGTIDYHEGEPPDERMREAAKRRGYALEGKLDRSRRAIWRASI